MAVAYGINSVLEALRADATRVERVCIQQGLSNPRLQEVIDLSRRRHVALSFEPKEWMDRKADGARHQGALCYVAETALLEPEDVIGQASTPGLLVILDSIEDPQNLGAILRSAEVAGADGVFLPERRSAGLSPAAVRASAGAASYMKIARVPNLARLLDSIKEKGYWTVGLDASAGEFVWQVDFTVPTALILGSEGKGLRRLVKEKCDFLARIPIRGKVGSYNVSVAAGISLYEVVRQRAEGPHGGRHGSVDHNVRH